MTTLTRNVRQTHALPPGRARMRYMRLKTPLTESSSGDEADTADVQCYACAETLISTVHTAAVAGLAVQCPRCGTVSEI